MWSDCKRDRLLQLGVRCGEDHERGASGGQYARAAREDFLNLARGDGLASSVDGILHAASHVQPAVCIELAKVASSEEATRGLRSMRRIGA